MGGNTSDCAESYGVSCGIILCFDMKSMHRLNAYEIENFVNQEYRDKSQSVRSTRVPHAKSIATQFQFSREYTEQRFLNIRFNAFTTMTQILRNNHENYAATTLTLLKFAA